MQGAGAIYWFLFGMSAGMPVCLILIFFAMRFADGQEKDFTARLNNHGDYPLALK